MALDRQQTANLQATPGSRISETLSKPVTDSANQLAHTSLVMTRSHLTHSHLAMPAHPCHAARLPPSCCAQS